MNLKEGITKENENIYLLADDFMHSSCAPKKGEKILVSNGNDYRLSMNNVYYRK